MKTLPYLPLAAGLLISSIPAFSQTPPGTSPYRLVNTAKVGGDGDFDYVTADPLNRRLYVPRDNRITVFDLDTLASVGTIEAKDVHGAVIDPASGHGFCSSNPVVMWDAKTLEPIKTIDVKGDPDGIFFDPATERVFIVSHVAPNLTVIDGKDGSVAGTIDNAGGAPEAGVSDGKGRVYIDIKDRGCIAVVDPAALKVLGICDLGNPTCQPCGLAIDKENGILFASCRTPGRCVILTAATGKVIGSPLPIGAHTDGVVYNPKTHEAFTSQADGLMTVIKEDDPANFRVEEIVKTHLNAKTCSLDPTTGKIYLIGCDVTQPSKPPAKGGGGAGSDGAKFVPQMIPGSFSIFVVGPSGP